MEEFIEGAYIEKLNACDKMEGWKHWQTLYQIEVFDIRSANVSSPPSCHRHSIFLYMRLQ
jgi:hypothetical protein